jgi:hypothetical protein
LSGQTIRQRHGSLGDSEQGQRGLHAADIMKDHPMTMRKRYPEDKRQTLEELLKKGTGSTTGCICPHTKPLSVVVPVPFFSRLLEEIHNELPPPDAQ